MERAEKLKRVAIVKDNSGKCKYVGEVVLVDKAQLNKLINEANEIDSLKIAKKRELQQEIITLKDELEQIKHEIKVLKGEE